MGEDGFGGGQCVYRELLEISGSVFSLESLGRIGGSGWQITLEYCSMLLVIGSPKREVGWFRLLMV